MISFDFIDQFNSIKYCKNAIVLLVDIFDFLNSAIDKAIAENESSNSQDYQRQIVNDVMLLESKDRSAE